MDTRGCFTRFALVHRRNLSHPERPFRIRNPQPHRIDGSVLAIDRRVSIGRLLSKEISIPTAAMDVRSLHRCR